MSKRQREQEVPVTPVQEPTTTAVATVEAVKTSDLFKRPINSIGPVRTLKLKRVLTRPLVSMSKRKELAVECQSEMYLMELPLTGRKGGTAPTRVFDAVELVPTEHGFQQGDEVIVLCHEIMASAIGKSGYSTIKSIDDGEGNLTFETISGAPLKGKCLGFISGDIADGKRYRAISVAELE